MRGATTLIARSSDLTELRGWEESIYFRLRPGHSFSVEGPDDEAATQSALTLVDWTLVAVYFGFVVWLGSHFGKKQTSSDRYFLGGRNLPGWAVGISIFATIISSWAFLGLPGKSFKDDIQFLISIVPLPFTMWVCGRYFIPLFRDKVKLSAYEYLERRFGLLARFSGTITACLPVPGHWY